MPSLSFLLINKSLSCIYIGLAYILFVSIFRHMDNALSSGSHISKILIIKTIIVVANFAFSGYMFATTWGGM